MDGRRWLRPEPRADGAVPVPGTWSARAHPSFSEGPSLSPRSEMRPLGLAPGPAIETVQGNGVGGSVGFRVPARGGGCSRLFPWEVKPPPLKEPPQRHGKGRQAWPCPFRRRIHFN